ncbi:hypothetical protein GW915_07290 [bacterium]|nr:hypothetical protein [bacterium]
MLNQRLLQLTLSFSFLMSGVFSFAQEDFSTSAARDSASALYKNKAALLQTVVKQSGQALRALLQEQTGNGIGWNHSYRLYSFNIATLSPSREHKAYNMLGILLYSLGVRAPFKQDPQIISAISDWLRYVRIAPYRYDRNSFDYYKHLGIENSGKELSSTDITKLVRLYERDLLRELKTPETREKLFKIMGELDLKMTMERAGEWKWLDEQQKQASGQRVLGESVLNIDFKLRQATRFASRAELQFFLPKIVKQLNSQPGIEVESSRLDPSTTDTLKLRIRVKGNWNVSRALSIDFCDRNKIGYRRSEWDFEDDVYYGTFKVTRIVYEPYKSSRHFPSFKEDSKGLRAGYNVEDLRASLAESRCESEVKSKGK